MTILLFVCLSVNVKGTGLFCNFLETLQVGPMYFLSTTWKGCKNIALKIAWSSKKNLDPENLNRAQHYVQTKQIRTQSENFPCKVSTYA